jgi:hypothetical protein
MHGLVTSGHRLRQRQSERRRFRHGQRAAAVRAFTGARLYLNCAVPTLAAAADSTGSCPAYIQAAIILLKADNASLTAEVLAGRVSLLQAAAQVRRMVDLVTAYKLAQDPDRVAFARACGVERIFNVLVATSN